MNYIWMYGHTYMAWGVSGGYVSGWMMEEGDKIFGGCGRMCSLERC